MSAPATSIPDVMPTYSHQQILQVLSGILLCILLGALDQTVVVPAVPAIARELHGFSHLSWIVTAYLLTSTAATPIYGKLSDTYGRRALLLPALLLFVVASCLCATAQSLLQLIAWRALQGLGAAGLVAMAQAVIADVVAPRERGRYQGYMASMWGIASVAGPIVGGYVTDHLSWRYIFWMNLPLGLLALWLSHRGLRQLPARGYRSRIDYLGAMLLTGGVTCWLLLLSWGGAEYTWGSPLIIALGVVGALLLLALAFLERRIDEPLLPPRLFGDGTFVGGVVVAFCGSLALFVGTFLLPLFFQLVRGVDAGTSGLLLIPFMFSNVLGAYAGGQVARRVGRTKGIVLGGLGACAIGFALLALLQPATPSGLVALAMIVPGAGIGMIMPTLLMQVQNACERRDVGVATGCILFLRSMGGAFGSTIGGALLALRFAGEMRALGVSGQINLGALQQGGDALANVGPALRHEALAALVSGFHLAFWVCVVVSVVAMAVAALVRDLALRSAGEPGAIGH
jgi:EmrB/QacA subfamily drug resistance transporter